MRKNFFLVISVIVFCSSFASAKNAFWKDNKITNDPLVYFAGTKITFKAILNIDSNEMQNLRIKAGVDNEVLHDKIYYYFQKNVDYPYQMEWTAKAGTHVIYFEVIATDSISRDDNASDNRVSRTISIKELKQSGGTPGGTPQKSTPSGVSAPSTKANMVFAPCTQYQDEATDLNVVYFTVRPKGANLWEYEARVTNLGRRCVKTVVYQVMNGNSVLVEARAGSAMSSSFILPDGATYTIKGTFANDGNFQFFTQGNSKYARFFFILDHLEQIPDPNRNNNKAQRDILMTW